MSNREIDEANALFWNELCGSGFARELGIADHSMESLRKFDQGYLDLYPYLLTQVPVATMCGRKVLEIGLGYGTLGQKIAEAGADYTGLDIAQGPVDMMNQRLAMQGLPGKSIQGSMLECTLPDASVDCVASIGCFHHTGDVARCIDETWRVLKPGGAAYIMVYNQFSYLQWVRWLVRTLRAALGRRADEASEAQRKTYDASAASGKAAPETVFVSKRELEEMMSRFSQVSMELENCGYIIRGGRLLFRRPLLLKTVGRLVGLDVYVSAVK